MHQLKFIIYKHIKLSAGRKDVILFITMCYIRLKRHYDIHSPEDIMTSCVSDLRYA